jgi:predicted ATPase/DNA-binding CsgD family transcriptional regulator
MEDKTSTPRTLEASPADAQRRTALQPPPGHLVGSHDQIEASDLQIQDDNSIRATTQREIPHTNRAGVLYALQPTPLIDRVEERASIRTSLVVQDVRLLTLTGPAGVGKTRLALAAASELASMFPDGVVLAELARVRDPMLVLQSLSRALGVSSTGHAPLLERLRVALKDRAILLLLDNFEHVLPAANQLVDLLAVCPQIHMLVTSRVPLQLRWEHILRIKPLPVPDVSTPLSLDDLGQVPAVALFLDRARARRPGFALTEARAQQVTDLVVHLDGLPLALELAAARLDALSLPVLVRLLSDRLQMLASSAPDAPERQRSLEAAITWSYDLLSPEEQRLFRHLGVFAGRVATSAVAAVVGADATPELTLRGLASLAEKSLIMLGQGEEDEEVEDQHGLSVFQMLETLREYAREQLERAGEYEAAERAHAHYFVALAERADALLRGSDQRAWFLRLEHEHDNLRAALRWLLDQDETAEREAGLRLAAALGYFWWMRGYHTEGARWLEEALARAQHKDEADPDEATLRTSALCWAGALLTMHGELGAACTRLEEARSLAQQRQDSAGIARALTFLGQHAVNVGEVERAVPLLREALRVARALGDPYPIGIALFFLGVATFAQGNLTEAAAHYSEALDLVEAAGDPRLIAAVHVELGVIAGQQSDLRSALLHLRAVLEASEYLRDRWLLSLGARATLAVVPAQGDAVAYARLQGAADKLRQATGGGRVPWETTVAEQTAAFHEGRSLSTGDVSALALRLLEDAAQSQGALISEPTQHTDSSTHTTQRPSSHAAQRENPLTEREQEVLGLVAQGLSNKAIARQLVISPSTVNYHLIQIFNKLVVETRAQAVAVAAQRGLL